MSFQHIPFVRAQNEDIPTNFSTKKRNTPESKRPINAGSAVKSFYEEVVELTTTDCTATFSQSEPVFATAKYISGCEGNKDGHSDIKDEPCGSSVRKETETRLSAVIKDKKNPTSGLRSHNAFLSAAQSGNLKLVKTLIGEGININYQDSYGWTALMCASHAGHSSVVKYLLKCGANSHVCDKKGLTAYRLAKIKQNQNIADLFEGKGTPSILLTPKVEEEETLHCDICKCDIKRSSVPSHTTSTMHLFNCKKQPNGTMFMIPHSNRGYQMMLRSGWNRNKGLGPEGRGKKFPVKTLLKRDRVGLGGKSDTQTKAKVTHFEPNDTEAIKNKDVKNSLRHMRTATLSKKRRSLKERKEKQIEKNFREQFHME